LPFSRTTGKQNGKYLVHAPPIYSKFRYNGYETWTTESVFGFGETFASIRGKRWCARTMLYLYGSMNDEKSSLERKEVN